MKKLIVLAIAALFCTIGADAKERNLEKMSEKRRNEYLIKIAKETVMQHGPGYYRDVAPPVIKKGKVTEENRVVPPDCFDKNIGRVYYTVEYPYDDTVETFKEIYAAKIWIWEDTGVPFSIFWGNGVGRTHLDDPGAWTGNEPKAKVQKSPPLKKK